MENFEQKWIKLDEKQEVGFEFGSCNLFCQDGEIKLNWIFSQIAGPSQKLLILS